MFRSVSSDLGKLAYVEIIVAERQIYRMQKLYGEYPKYSQNIAPIFPRFFFLQEPPVTRLPIIVACHLPPRILIMTRAAATVTWIIKASGGTIVVTSPIWMVCTQERIKGTAILFCVNSWRTRGSERGSSTWNTFALCDWLLSNPPWNLWS